MKIDYRRPGYYTWVDAKISEGGTTIEYSLDIKRDVPSEIVTLLEAVSDLYSYSDISERDMVELIKEHVISDIKYLEDED